MLLPYLHTQAHISQGISRTMQAASFHRRNRTKINANKLGLFPGFERPVNPLGSPKDRQEHRTSLRKDTGND